MKTSLILALALAAALAQPAQAHRGNAASDLSAASLLPVAVSVAAPVAIFASGAALTVVAVESVSDATVWVLERAADGARTSITLSGNLANGVSVAAGTAVVVSVVSTGWLLSTAGQAIAWVPNQVGRALLHNERITR